MDFNVNVRFDDKDVWLSQQQIAILFDTTQQNISLHINGILEDSELSKEATHKFFLLVRQEGSRSVKRQIEHYNLDMIIAIGYRVKSQVATRFRQWATQRLHEYIQKGFAIDDERLKGNGNRYFRELLQRIRDIRSSERNLYQQVTDIYATAIDYDPRNDITRQFFATVQNKMHYAAHQHTAAEIIYHRVDSGKPTVGMTNFKGDYITRDDVLSVGNRPLLSSAGTVSHKQALEKATQEFEEYRRKEMLQYESDFDRAIKELKSQTDGNISK
ncbi:MAG: RhuM family protein [Parabacteroides gordonii]|uniref:RhuM family protein n=1 Tax=Parabacteroides gordonii TaxID=574930 RepID=UPI003A8601B0